MELHEKSTAGWKVRARVGRPKSDRNVAENDKIKQDKTRQDNFQSRKEQATQPRGVVAYNDCDVMSGATVKSKSTLALVWIMI